MLRNATGAKRTSQPTSPGPMYQMVRPGFPQVEQCDRLLERAPDHDLLAYVVLSLFTGIRVAELRRLTWDKVKLGEGVIIIDGSVAKHKSRRIVDLNETARAWLAICGRRTGSVVDPVNFRKRNDPSLAPGRPLRQARHRNKAGKGCRHHVGAFGQKGSGSIPQPCCSTVTKMQYQTCRLCWGADMTFFHRHLRPGDKGRRRAVFRLRPACRCC